MRPRPTHCTCRRENQTTHVLVLEYCPRRAAGQPRRPSSTSCRPRRRRFPCVRSAVMFSYTYRHESRGRPWYRTVDGRWCIRLYSACPPALPCTLCPRPAIPPIMTSAALTSIPPPAAARMGPSGTAASGTYSSELGAPHTHLTTPPYADASPPSTCATTLRRGLARQPLTTAARSVPSLACRRPAATPSCACQCPGCTGTR